jgi:hypothetical protein
MLAVVLGVFTIAAAQGMKMGGSAIEGTWQFVSRKLPDGTTITPPMCIGLQTFSGGMRNFNVAWVDKTGKHFSFSVISDYKLTGKDYTETMLYSCMNDEIGMMKDHPAGNGPMYTMKSEAKTVPVTMEGNKLKFKLPFDPPEVVIDGNTMTATLEGGFVDTWKKIP